MQRAHYLGEQLKTTCHDELGLAGRQMIDWLVESWMRSIRSRRPHPGGGGCSGPCGLYIFNNHDGALTLAPGSPHGIQNIVSLAVLPAQ